MRKGLARLRAVVVVGLLVATWDGLRGAGRRPPENVILVSIDTLRADHRGVYGYHRDTSPRAVPQSHGTGPSHMSLFTSLYYSAFAEPGPPASLPVREPARRGLLDSTVVIVTSDHGEEFREHGMLMHWQMRFPSTLHVPLLIHVPGVAPRWVDETVELIDVLPTAHRRLRPPSAPLQSRHRRPRALRDRRPSRSAARPVGSGARDGGASRDRARRTPTADRARSPDLVRRGPVGHTVLDAATRKQLEALGYLPVEPNPD